MANFELIGYVKSSMNFGDKTRLTVGEYINGRRDKYGAIHGEKMDLWHIFFPKSSRRHLLNFKPNDLVIVKGTIYQSASDDYAYCVNGECIKHFYTRNILNEIKQEKISSEMMEIQGETPDLSNFDNSDDF